MSKVNELIKSRRLELGMTLEEVGDKVGVGKSTVRKWETGLIENMRRDNLVSLAEVLQLSPLELLDVDFEEKEDINIYGNHEKNIEAFKHDLELLEFYMEMHESDNLRLLFDTARELTPKELEKVLRYMKLVIEEEL